MDLTRSAGCGNDVRSLAASLDRSSTLSLSFTELWMGGFYKQLRKSRHSEATCPNGTTGNVEAMQRLLQDELRQLAARIGGTLIAEPVKAVPGSVDRHNQRYVTCPDMKLSVGRQDDCILRIRANPCSPESWTKLWLYIFRQDSVKGISFQSGVDFMAEAEELCERILAELGAAVEREFDAESTGNLVTIYNFGSTSEVVKDLVSTKTAEEWDSLAASVGSEPLLGVCDLLGLLARDGAEGDLDLVPCVSVPEMPFVTSIVDVEDETPEDGPSKYQGLYTQRLYDGEAKVRISGIAAGDSFEDWHKPAQPFALNYVVSL